MSSVDIVRLFPDIDGVFDINDSFWVMNRPWYGWTITPLINASITSFYANAAFIVDGTFIAGLSVEKPMFDIALNTMAELDAGLKTKKQIFSAAFISEKVN